VTSALFGPDGTQPPEPEAVLPDALLGPGWFSMTAPDTVDGEPTPPTGIPVQPPSGPSRPSASVQRPSRPSPRLSPSEARRRSGPSTAPQPRLPLQPPSQPQAFQPQPPLRPEPLQPALRPQPYQPQPPLRPRPPSTPRPSPPADRRPSPPVDRRPPPPPGFSPSAVAPPTGRRLAAQQGAALPTGRRRLDSTNPLIQKRRSTGAGWIGCLVVLIFVLAAAIGVLQSLIDAVR